MPSHALSCGQHVPETQSSNSWQHTFPHIRPDGQHWFPMHCSPLLQQMLPHLGLPSEHGCGGVTHWLLWQLWPDGQHTPPHFGLPSEHGV